MRHSLFKFLALFCLAFTSAQNVNISGTVQDESGIPIPGVNIIVKNTTKGSVSDFDGNFTVTGVEIGSTLNFSYIGYITQEQIIKNNSKLTITLVEDIAKLDEVIVIGYGTQTKKEITGAVSVVSSETIEALRPTRIEQALQGQVAGVNVTTNTGSPGGSSTISIRGVSTNGDSRPLILVDGNVVEELSVVNPSDIKSINILKDATAGIYGVRAANGVILITTKTGRKDMPMTIEYEASTGFQQTTRKIPVLNATEYAVILNEAFAAGGSTPPYSDLSILGVGTDWQDEIFQTAPIQNQNISFRGGKKKSAYSYSGSFLTQDGIVGGSKSNFTRFTNTLNYNVDLLDNFKFKSGITLTRLNRKGLPENSNASVLFNALNIAPTLSIYDENGDFTKAEGLGAEIVNPKAQIENTYNRNKVMKLNGFAGLSYNFLDHFSAEANIQFNYAEETNFSFNPIVDYGVGKVFNVQRSVVFEGLNYFRDYTFDGLIKYENKINDIHNINLLIGTSVLKTTGEYTGFRGYDIPGNTIENANIESASDVENVNQALGRNPTFDARLLSYFARAQYDYKGKYLISAVVRRDGSTKFGPENKFGIFPSGSFGWVASDENFLKDNNLFDLLKLRVSYGILGNDRIGDYRFVSLLNGEGTYFFGGNDRENQYFGVASGGIANPEIKWEKQKTFDVGLDMRIFDNKVDITTDYFKRRTEGLLVSPDVSVLLGTGAPPFVNAGVVENSGLEFAIGYSNKLSDNFKLSVNYNVTYIKNEVISVSGEGEYLEGGSFGVPPARISRMEAGHPMGYFIGYQTDGVFQNQTEIDNAAVGDIAPQPGDFRFVDQNKDGVIDLDDRVDLGNPLPDVTMGLRVSLDYKNWDFSAYAQANIGNEIVRNYERNQNLVNKPLTYLDRWTGEGTSNTSPRVTTAASTNTVFSDFYLEDGSFVRLQMAQLGYTFNNNNEKSKLKNLRIYISGNNLFTLTKYNGYDPTAGNGAPIGGGIDQGFYPTARTFLLGVNVKF